MRASSSGPVLATLLLAAAGALAPAGSAVAQDAAAALKPSVSENKSAAKKTAAAPQKPAAASAAAAEAGPDSKAAAKTPAPTRSAAKDAAPAARRKPGQSIIVLVGDDPITGYEVEQRQRLLSQGAGISKEAQARFQTLIKSKATQDRMKAIQDEVVRNNPGKSREQLIAMIKGRMQEYGKALQKQAVESARGGAIAPLRQKALEQVIDERLMMQEAKRVGVLAADDEIDKLIEDKAKRSNVTVEQYKGNFKSMGIDIETLRMLYRAQLSWQEVIRRRFGYQIQVTEREIDRIVSKGSKEEEDDVELQLQRIVLTIPDKLDQKIMAKRFQEAETLWRRFDGCKSLPALSTGTAGSRLENIGPQRPSAITEPTRGILVSAADNTMVPPIVGTTGIELWAVCGRSVVKANDKQREEAESIARREQFTVLADRHLKDLRKDTPIEYKDKSIEIR